MKQSIAHTEARSRLANIADESRDGQFAPRNWRSKPGEGLSVLGITQWAKGQLLSKLGIPVAYYDICPAFLQELQYSYWRDRLEERGSKLTVRGRCNTIRCIVSERYAAVGGLAIFDALETLFAEGLVITLFEITDESFHLRLVDPKSLAESNLLDPLFCGVHISNSEVGYRPVSVDSVVYRQVCSNGLVVLHGKTGILRRRGRR